jgi:hypothetical protein
LEINTTFRRSDLGLAYAATGVNACIFRINALTSFGGKQYVTYYDPDGFVMVGQRTLCTSTWQIERLEARGNVQDAHNSTVMGISSDGLLHLCYDHHNHPLRYRVSSRPEDITSFGSPRPMTGQNEEHVCYPNFLNSPDGSFYFFFRDGTSGNGGLCLNRYRGDGEWDVVHHPLIDGLGKASPYWWRPDFGPDGTIHLAWCWRSRFDANSNHDICYMRSRDGGKTWERGDGTPQSLPATLENAQIVDAIPMESNLLNTCGLAVDAENRPHLSHYYNDAKGVPQYYHLWQNGEAVWQSSIVSQRTQPFSVAGQGSLELPISRPEIAVDSRGHVWIITKDAEIGGGIRLYHSPAPYTDWQPLDLTRDDLGNWEPAYDLTRWRVENKLSLFVIPVRQGDHETVADFPPQMAWVLDWSPYTSV